MPNEARQLLSHLQGLARQQPASADAAAALERARAALVTRRSRRRRWLRISIPSGIAACLLAAALLAFFMRTSPSAHASADFQRAVTAAKNYQGWVQVVATPRGTITVPGRGKLVSITCRSNAAEGMMGQMWQYEGHVEMAFGELKQKSLLTYSSTNGQIQHRTLGEDDDDEPRDLLLPTGVADAMARVKSTLGHDPPALQPTREGGDLRVDVRLFDSHAEENEYHRRNNSARVTPPRFSVWINSQNMITRMSCDTMGGTLESAVSYEASPVTSIYDLGVPRNAPIIESRSRERDGDRN